MTSNDLKQFFRHELGLRDEFADDALIFSTGVIDSFAMIELITFIEGRAGIKVAPMEVTLENLDSIDRILSFVAAKQG